jgi:hypothetical protein
MLWLLREYSAVTNVVSTNWFGAGYGSANAGRYTLNGVPTGTSWQGTPPLNGGDSLYDGTSDGRHNYAVEYTSSARTESVIQTDLNWQNPKVFFTFDTDGEYIGITYDPYNKSLWLSDYFTGAISDYTLKGKLLSSFATPLIPVALAFDRADGTLWFSQDESSTLYQYSDLRQFSPIRNAKWASCVDW